MQGDADGNISGYIFAKHFNVESQNHYIGSFFLGLLVFSEAKEFKKANYLEKKCDLNRFLV